MTTQFDRQSSVALLFIQKTAVDGLKTPFAPSLSRGEWGFQSHPMGECRKTIHASTGLGTNASTLLSRNSFFDPYSSVA